MTSEDRARAIDLAISQIEKQFGRGAIMRLGEHNALEVEAIPTGSLGLDLALGIGGIPRGRVTELYGPERTGGTLRAYAGQRVHDDWARAVGRQDLTAHVDLSALERATRAAGLETLGQTSQASFLMGAGVDALLEAIRSDPATSIEDWLAVRSAIARMLDPRLMGGFLVLVVGRGLAPGPPLRGLAYRLGR